MKTPDQKMTMTTADYMTAAMQAHQEGRSSEAASGYARVLELEPDNMRALRLSAILAREQGRIEFALSALTRATELQPDAADAHAELGLTQMYIGELDAAEDSLRTAHGLTPNSIDILTNLGALLQHRGHLHAAIELYRQVLEQDANETAVHCNLIKALSEIGDFDSALAETTHAEQRDKSFQAQAARAAVLIDAQEFSEAHAILDRALMQETMDDIGWVNLAFCCLQLDQTEEACINLQRALEKNPHNARAVADLINCYSRLGRHQDATDLGMQFLSHFPGERLIVGSLALALDNAGQHAAAREMSDYEQLVQIHDWADTNDTALEALNQELTRSLEANPSLIRNPISKATFGGTQTGELNLDNGQAWRIFGSEADKSVRKATDMYRAAGLSAHPVMQPAGQSWSLRAWGTLLESGGYQSPHMHPLAWLSAVYYVALPKDMGADGDNAGWLEFGAIPDHYFSRNAPTTKRVEPKEGRLIIFPSWIWHRTLPFTSPSKRISVAFDVMPRSKLRTL